jgi:hypothetical protein
MQTLKSKPLVWKNDSGGSFGPLWWASLPRAIGGEYRIWQSRNGQFTVTHRAKAIRGGAGRRRALQDGATLEEAQAIAQTDYDAILSEDRIEP